MADNKLYYGDNLDILRRYVKDETVDLVYLDPPFNSNQSYNVLFAEQDGSRSAAQIKAFGDTWRWDLGAEEAYLDVVENGPELVADAMRAFRTFLSTSDMMAYLAMMAPRLVELRRVLRPTGSIYLHCDPTASHYLKILMDAVFGAGNFRNEIIWRRMGAHNATRTLGSIHDVILFYSKGGNYTFNIVRRPYMKGHVERRYTETSDGRWRFTSGGNVLTGPGAGGGDSCQPWRGFDPATKGRHWAVPRFYEQEMPEDYRDLLPTEKLEALYSAGLVEIEEGNQWPVMVRYLGERDGVPIQDIWAYQPYTEGTLHGTKEGIDADVQWMGPTGPERLGYPTQKPIGLLDRIIRTGSNPGDVVLDPFCGCGTAVAVAQKLGRKWMGIDITHLAITLIKHRLESAYGGKIMEDGEVKQGIEYDVLGEPTAAAGAQQLAKDDPYQFQFWALGLVGARPVEQKKGADKGIDGRIYFHDEADSKKTKQVILQVKAGKTGVGHVRDLRGVIDREDAQIGALITMQNPTQPMKTEAASAGFYEQPGTDRKFPRIQLLTVTDLLGGAILQYPRGGEATFRRAPRATRKRGTKQLPLGGHAKVNDADAPDGDS